MLTLYEDQSKYSNYKVTIREVQRLLKMKVLITGAAGFIGTKLTATILSEGEIGGRKVTELVLVDVEQIQGIPSETHFPVKAVTTDLSKGIENLLEGCPDVIFHLASMSWNDAEDNFDEGMRANIDLTRNLLDGIREIDSYKPRLVYGSSVAVFGGPPFPDSIADNYHRTPQTSYGTEKAMCELLIDDYSRRGFVDGICIRLPTITIRPQFTNKSVMDFLSNIIAEPLRGMETVCPVPLSMRHDVASPRSAVRFLLYAAIVSSDKLYEGLTRAITMPSLCVSIGEMIESLVRVTGKGATKLIKVELDPAVEKVFASFPTSRLEAKRAEELGFILNDAVFDDCVFGYIYDDLGGHKYSLPQNVIASNHAPEPIVKPTIAKATTA
mmetsp:Transcript_7618/g.10375  ORF Transcript_7618/g.10375 Transcript_7618/m.10375 type:complete len:383 (-) Transcript_7618:159-1307(-)